MIRIIFYLLLAFLLWRFVKRLFIGSGADKFRDQLDDSSQNRTSEINYNDVDDAKYEDIDN